MTKPVFGFIAGRTAHRDARWPCRRHRRRGAGTHASKVEALQKAGITVVDNLSEIGQVVARSRKAVAA